MTLLGWCPGGRPVDVMLNLYPGTGTVRLFVGAGKPIPEWGGPVLGPLGTTVVPHLSFKTWDLGPVVKLVDGIPDGQLLILTYAHEPEQGTAAGDPTPEVFHARWAELVAALADHPKRDRLLLVPVYTRYWWQANRGDRRWLVTAPVDAHGWDIYNNGTGYRSPDDLLAIPRQVALDTGLPYLVAELGATVVGANVTGRSAWMRSMVDAAKADGALTVAWFHKDDWDLTTGLDAQQTWQTLITREAPVTTAPRNLLDVRTLLLAELGPYGLEPAEVGIVGDPNHRGGYHCGRNRTLRGDYSVVESRRDSTGLTDNASGLDLGTFSYRAPDGRIHNLASFSKWCVGQCAADAPDTADIREIIYSPDGRTVRRWDRLGKRTSGDSSHRTHTHFSFFRDSTKAGRDQTPLFRRYLASIGLIDQEDDMPTIEEIQTAVERGIHTALTKAAARPDPYGRQVGDAIAKLLAPVYAGQRALGEAIAREAANPDEVRALLAELPRPEPVDVDELAQAVADRVPEGTGPVSRAELVAAIREVLAGLAVPAS
ncbi:hypothetical protein M3G91_10140 [Micromonospora chalcea]|uniref:hypothetical protein n=1 Tax=Micromonospora chalcea TaxID=1874 RepID=UPI0021A38A5A|nr:hypothetical protein [Micromonospora chalcea]MCT2277984.1 hypothetical protein [Micromonospora chalcea]